MILRIIWKICIVYTSKKTSQVKMASKDNSPSTKLKASVTSEERKGIYSNNAVIK